MYEMALVRNVVDVVLDEAEAAHAAEVRAVHLVIGEGRDVVEEYFESLFQFLARGTVAEHAEVVIRRVPYRVQCKRCGAVFHVNMFDRTTWACPACEAYQDYMLVSGMKFSISKIEAVERERTSA